MTEIGNFVVAHWEAILGALVLILATDGLAGYLPDKWVPYVGAVRRVAEILLARFGKIVPVLLAVMLLGGCAGLKLEDTAAPMAIPPPPGLSSDGARGIRVEGAVAIGATGSIAEETNTMTFDDGDGAPITLQDIRTGASGGDATAIHDNVAAEISAITAKAGPLDADFLLIESAADANAKRSLTLSNFWTYYLKGKAVVNQWTTDTSYEEFQIVSNNAMLYYCTGIHTSGATTEPGAGASWTDSWAYLGTGVYQPLITGTLALGTAGTTMGQLTLYSNVAENTYYFAVIGGADFTENVVLRAPPSMPTVANMLMNADVTTGNMGWTDPAIFMLASNAGIAPGNYLTLQADPGQDTLYGFDNTSNTYHPIILGTNLTYDEPSNTLNAGGGTFAGGTLTSELVIDETGIEGQPTDAITDCSSFAATGGGLFYDDSEGQWKKCQDNVLSDLDTGGGMTNPMTTQYDIIYGGAAGAPTRLGATANAVVGWNGSGVLGAYTTHRHDDSAAQFSDNADATKLLQILLDNITTGTTRTVDVGDYNSQIPAATDVDATGHISAVVDGSIAPADLDTSADDDAIEFVIDGGGSAITTGVKGFLEIPYACTINSVTMLADQSGSIVVDLWVDAYANYPPTDADTITAAAVPTISAATNSQNTTLTGWTTSLTKGQVIGYNVDSAATVTRVTISLKVDK